LNVTEKKDPAYFNSLYAEINGGGVAAMLHDLLKVDLSEFNLREVPKTKALIEQQFRSADSLTRWILDAGFSGQMMPGEQTSGFGEQFTTVRLHGAYKEWVKAQGAGRPMTVVEFGRKLGKLGFISVRVKNLAGWQVPADPTAVLAAAMTSAGIHKASP
jgi:phage/plasmid-associated DNA primase